MNKINKGIMISEIGFSNLPIMLKNANFDFFIIDAEHGGFDYREVATMITIANLYQIEPYIRIPDNNRKDIIKYCDMGIKGLILPMTNNVEDIAQVVKYAKYSPIGKRGISTTRAHTFYNPSSLDKYKETANNSIKVFAQIETKAGLENIDDILSCNGVFGALIGPNDLSDELGCLNDKDSQLIKDAIFHISASAHRYNKVAGIISSNQTYLKGAKQDGMTWFSVGSELSILIKGLNDINKGIDNL